MATAVRVCCVEGCEKRLRSDNKTGYCRVHCDQNPAVKERKRLHGRNNKERKRQTNREWRKKNPEKCRSYSKKHRLNNSQKRKDSANSWRRTNPEKAKASTDNWRKKNPDKQRTYDGNRRHAKAGMSKTGWKAAAYMRDLPCAQCGEPPRSQVDHIIPLAWAKTGQPDCEYFQEVLSNVWAYQPLCRSCNCSKNKFFFGVFWPTGDIGD